jgi:arginine decarboxylase-like protein
MKLITCNKDRTISELIETDDISSLMRLLDFHTERLERNGFMLVNEYTTGLQIIREFASKENGWECAYGVVDKITKKVTTI